MQEVSEITTGLKALAKELNVPFLVLSQLSREVEKRRTSARSWPICVKSGSIEQDADVVMFVYREEYYLERAQARGRHGRVPQMDRRHETGEAARPR